MLSPAYCKSVMMDSAYESALESLFSLDLGGLQPAQGPFGAVVHLLAQFSHELL